MWLFLLEVRRHIACRMADEARLFARNCGLEAINIGSNSKFATIRRLFSIFRKLSGTGKKNANISRSVFFTEPEFYQVLLYRVLLYLYRDIELRVIQRAARITRFRASGSVSVGRPTRRSLPNCLRAMSWCPCNAGRCVRRPTCWGTYRGTSGIGVS